MVLEGTIGYLTQPLDTMDLAVLRNMVVCGVTTLVVVMMGFSRFIVMVFYLLVLSIVLIVTWLYSLENCKRVLVINRVKEVLNSLMQLCIDEALSPNGKTVKKDISENVCEQKDSPATPSASAAPDKSENDIVDTFSKLLQ